jgi:hypothetical protein
MHDERSKFSCSALVVCMINFSGLNFKHKNAACHVQRERFRPFNIPDHLHQMFMAITRDSFPTETL